MVPADFFLIQDSDHRASWSQLGLGDHLQGLGGEGSAELSPPP
jgi:hypothetical protein